MRGAQNKYRQSLSASAVATQVAACNIRASDIAVHSRTTEATLGMKAIRPAAKLPHRAGLIPEVGHRWLAALRPRALVLRGCRRLWAWHRLKRSLGAEAALWVQTVGPATQHPIPAIRVPEVWHCW